MDKDSPFAAFQTTKPVTSAKTVYVLFCDNCHYLWKSGAPTTKCINCNDEAESARCLVHYENDAPRI